MDELKKLLGQFKQIILYGPPGTGKTRAARKLACGYIVEQWLNKKCGKTVEKINKIDIMITHYSDHWDKKQETSYSKGIIWKDGKRFTGQKTEELETDLTFFIKSNEQFNIEQKNIEHMWIGCKTGIKMEIKEEKSYFHFKPHLCFEVSNIKDIWEKLKNIITYKKSGWYIFNNKEKVKDLVEHLILPLSKNFKNYWEIVQFHPTYNYDDFVRGIEVKSEGNNIKYEKVDRIFVETCKKAEKNANMPYFLIIDEINRANLPAVLGELMYALEYRGEEIRTLSGDSLKVPENLYIIGTMNTADRSAGRIDYAIRRRFVFYPIYACSEKASPEGKKLMEEVNKFIEDKIAPDYDPEDIKIGHSYFMGTEEQISYKFLYQVVPLIYEYIVDGILNVTKGSNGYKIKIRDTDYYIKGGTLYFNSERVTVKQVKKMLS